MISGERARHAAGVRVMIGRAIVAMLGVAALLLTTQADAQFYWYGRPGPPRWSRLHRAPPAVRLRRPRHRSGEEPVQPAANPHGPLIGVIALSEQRIYIYNSDGLVASSKISTGMPGHRTPSGVFSIIGRERWHRSNIYSGAPMPYMQRITWSGVALHLGVVPGYPASHGCIRLPSGFAERLWGMTKIGERVVIATQAISPAPFAHALLPEPTLQPLPTRTAAALPVPLAQSANPSAMAALASSVSDAQAAGAPAPALLNPLQYAQALKAQAAADAAAAATALKQASERARASAEEVRKAYTHLRVMTAADHEADRKLAARRAAVAAASNPLAREAAEAAAAAAATEAGDAAVRRQEAEADAERAKHEAEAAASAIADARRSLAAAHVAAKEATRRLSPVSVLVSMKDRRVYVRQGLVPVFDAPASVRDPAAPLGTHVFIASSLEGATLGWTVISIPPEPVREGIRSRHGREAARPGDAELVQAIAPSNPAQALERIEIPKEARVRIEELVWTGASFIVSDERLSDETSDDGTDIVVRTR